jgi:mRNA interferase MazF
VIGNRPPLVPRGTTFMVNFNPTMGHEQSGIRPGVVVSAEEMSAAGIVLIAPTTTQKLDYVRPYEVLVPAGHGLPEDSKVLLNQLRTIDMAERVRERLGILDDDLMMDVDRALLIVLFGPGVAA